MVTTFCIHNGMLKVLGLAWQLYCCVQTSAAATSLN